MKKIILLSIVLCSCEPEKRQNFDIPLEELCRPIIVFAKDMPASDAGFHGGYGSVVLKTKDGKYIVYRGESYLGSALQKTYNVGDTIR